MGFIPGWEIQCFPRINISNGEFKNGSSSSWGGGVGGEKLKSVRKNEQVGECVMESMTDGNGIGNLRYKNIWSRGYIYFGCRQQMNEA